MNANIGEPFSLFYLRPEAPLRDSARLRNRLAGYYTERIKEQHNEGVRRLLARERGIVVPYSQFVGFDVAQVFVRFELRDMLDAITYTYRAVLGDGFPHRAEEWRQFVARAFREEGLGYALDPGAGVRYTPDEEFDRSRAASIAGLGAPRYAAVRDAFEKAFGHLEREPRDTTAAVRAAFEALEILARLMVASQNLTRYVLDNALKQHMLRHAQQDATIQQALAKQLEAFGDWIDAAHFYRHGQPNQEPAPPSLEYAVFFLSTASAYLRWLLEVDRKMQAAAAAGQP